MRQWRVGQTLTVDGTALTVDNTLTFNGAAETNGISTSRAALPTTC
jgi:hypothetical protein